VNGELARLWQSVRFSSPEKDINNIRSGYLSNAQESAQRWRLVPAASHSRDSPSMFAKLTAAHIREYTRPIVCRQGLRSMAEE
jgi:hypothetical protein